MAMTLPTVASGVAFPMDSRGLTLAGLLFVVGVFVLAARLTPSPLNHPSLPEGISITPVSLTHVDKGYLLRLRISPTMADTETVGFQNAILTGRDGPLCPGQIKLALGEQALTLRARSEVQVAVYFAVNECFEPLRPTEPVRLSGRLKLTRASAQSDHRFSTTTLALPER